MVFAVKNLETVHSYPSESSYMSDEVSGSFYTDGSLASYHANSPNFDLEAAIQHERERLRQSNYENKEDEDLSLSKNTDGDHFNSYSTQEDGSVMLF